MLRFHALWRITELNLKGPAKRLSTWKGNRSVFTLKPKAMNGSAAPRKRMLSTQMERLQRAPATFATQEETQDAGGEGLCFE